MADQPQDESPEPVDEGPPDPGREQGPRDPVAERGPSEAASPAAAFPAAASAAAQTVAVTVGRRRWPGVADSVRAVNRALFGVGRRRLLIGGAVMLSTPAILVGAMSGYGLWATSQPSFCGSCHVMEPYLQAWDASPHRDVNCESCHIPPGTAAFVGGKIAGLQVVINYWTGNYEEDRSFNAVVGNASCLRCHEEVLEGTVTGEDGLRVSHRGIVAEGGKCITCHSTVAHESAMKAGARTYPQMQTCFRCHDGTTASAGCTTCHEPRKTTTSGGTGAAATTP